MNPYSICYSAVAPCQEYDRLKADPDIKHPEKHMLNTSRRQGQYQGCFSKSHWGGKRISQQWDLFCEIAPKQAKMYSELPNHVRALLGIEERKHNNSKFKASEGTHRVPTALIVALESLLMERIHLGEEVTYDLAASVLLRLVGLWNEKLQELTAEARGVGHQVLKQQDMAITGRPTEEEEHEMEKDGAAHMAGLFDSLRECKIVHNSPSLMILGLGYRTASECFHILYCTILYCMKIQLKFVIRGAVRI